MRNKRGLSDVVVTVLIILLIVAAIAIIWAAVIPMIRTNIEGSEKCISADVFIDSSSGYTCTDLSKNTTAVMVTRGGSNIEIREIMIIFNLEGNSYQRKVNAPAPGNSITYYFINMDFKPDLIRVAPIVKIGGRERQCDVTHSFSPSLCSLNSFGNVIDFDENETEEDDCTSLCNDGESVCFGEGEYRICGDYDNDGCFEWGDAIDCDEGKVCEGGVCEVQPIYISECGILDIPNMNYLVSEDIVNHGLEESCIKISAENITLDCLGKRIDVMDEWGLGNYEAISVSSPHARIQNCNITNSQTLVYAIQLGLDSNFSVIQNSTIFNSRNGLYIFEGNYGSVISGNNFVSNMNGIFIIGGVSNLTIKDNYFKSNRGFFEGGGYYNALFALQFANSSILNNLFEDNSHDMFFGDGNNYVTGLIVKENVIRRTESTSVSMSSLVSENIFEDNSFYDTFAGISCSSCQTCEPCGNNIFRKNQIIRAKSEAISLGGANQYNLVEANSIQNSQRIGIKLYGSSNNISSNNITGSGDYGIRVMSGAGNNFIYNNFLFNNSLHFTLWDGTINFWNISKTEIFEGNVIGGNYLGGNYYGNLDGTDFSQTCEDLEDNGICDTPKSHDIDNIDYLPLTQ